MSMTQQMQSNEELAALLKPKRRFRRVEAMILIPNLVLLGILGVYLLGKGLTGQKQGVRALVNADTKKTSRIATLEQMLRDNPADLGSAITLSKLYEEAGELPWSYDALRAAEKRSTVEPRLRLRLGLAYLQLGKNKDGMRVLRTLIEHCEKESCRAHIESRAKIYRQVARLFLERGIDARVDHRGADKVMREVIKPALFVPFVPQAEKDAKKAAEEAQAGSSQKSEAAVNRLPPVKKGRGVKTAPEATEMAMPRVSPTPGSPTP